MSTKFASAKQSNFSSNLVIWNILILRKIQLIVINFTINLIKKKFFPAGLKLDQKITPRDLLIQIKHFKQIYNQNGKHITDY